MYFFAKCTFRFEDPAGELHPISFLGEVTSPGLLHGTVS